MTVPQTTAPLAPYSFDAAFSEFRGPLVQYAMTFLHDTAASHDIVQDAFVRLWKHHGDLPSAVPVRAWLFTAVRNLCLNLIRDQRTRALIHTDVVAASAMSPREIPRPDQLLDSREASAQLQLAIGTLPPRQREALILSRFNGLSHAEVARVMGCTARTVNNQLVRALDRLRKAMRGSQLSQQAAVGGAH
jgi:RNA polymerase sigma-70 factor (family 1)